MNLLKFLKYYRFENTKIISKFREYLAKNNFLDIEVAEDINCLLDCDADALIRIRRFLNLYDFVNKGLLLEKFEDEIGNICQDKFREEFPKLDMMITADDYYNFEKILNDGHLYSTLVIIENGWEMYEQGDAFEIEKKYTIQFKTPRTLTLHMLFRLLDASGFRTDGGHVFFERLHFAGDTIRLGFGS